MTKKIRVAHLTFQLSQGGAGLAVRNLHNGLQYFSTIESRIITSPLDPRNPALNLYKNCALKTLRHQYDLVRRISDRVLARLTARQYSWQSFSVLPSLNASVINRLPVDIVHLHWVQAGFISIDAISRIKKPLVWTLHDLWPLMASEHVPIYHDGYFDLGAQTSYRKHFSFKAYKKRLLSNMEIDFIAPSQMTADLAKKTLNYSTKHRIHVIQNCFVAAQHQSMPTIENREGEKPATGELPIVLFGAHGFLSDTNKGWDIFSLLVDKVAAYEADIKVEIFGDSRYHSKQHPRIHSHGAIKDSDKLRDIYSRATVFASFSYFETFCYAGLEAASCGASIICFDSSSLAEIVRNYSIGMILSAHSSRSSIVAETIAYAYRTLESRRLRQGLPADLVDLLSSASISARHEVLYQSLARKTLKR
jgi:glycosyltransferase involved in cell wall biosynthesis